MPKFAPRSRALLPAATLSLALAPFASAQTSSTATGTRLFPGNLVVSRSVYDNNPANIAVGTILPPDCVMTSVGCPNTGAPYNGSYPYVFNNDIYDGSFGITSRIYLDQITPFGFPISTIQVPNSLQKNVTSSTDQLVTSFSSKSELALHLSTDRKYLTFMGYVAPVDALDVSNSNTPGVVDLTNPDGTRYYRAIARLDAKGNFTFTATNAYSGNNGRAAILNDKNRANVYYTAGNAGNGANPQPNGVILGAGAQLVVPSTLPEASQMPGLPTPVASFNITELGLRADKIGKDDNFRGMAIFRNVLYYTKGSGGNGVNTVYFVDTTGKACPNGVGLPVDGAALPTAPLTYSATTLQTSGLPSNMCILAGFPTALAKSANPLAYPFSIFFANKNTLYIADEGDGYAGGTDLYTHAAAQTTAGLQKWIFDATSNTWKFAYTLSAGLGLGTPYTVAGYPAGNNPATNLPWAPATDGLRNITGYVLGKDVFVWAVTSTTSGNGDLGADPNRLVYIEDALDATQPPPSRPETFTTLRTAGFGEVLRGVSFTPGTELGNSDR